MRFLIGFSLGIFVSYLFIDQGINLPKRLGNAINWHELQQLGQDLQKSLPKDSDR